VVFNKADLVSDDDRLVLRGLEPHGIFASARTGEGIDEVLAAISAALPRPSVQIELLVPYDRGDVVSRLHVAGRVESTDYSEEGTIVHARVSEAEAASLAEFTTSSTTATA
jgi:GTP-binding protein HflX